MISNHSANARRPMGLPLKKIFVAAVIAGGLVFASQAYAEDMILFYDGTSHVYTAAPIQLQVDGRTITGLPMPPILINDRTLVPARETFEALGAVVSWKPATREVYIGYNNRLVVLQIDNQIANIDGRLEVMDVAPKIVNDKTMLPLRFASEALGLEVGWDEITRVAAVWNREPQVSVATAVSLPQPALSTDALEMPRDVSAAKIPVQQYPETRITDVRVPADGTSIFAVVADSPISKVDTFPLAGRIVLDIYNAEMSASKTTWNVGSGVVEQVRMAQNQTEPEMVTRVVLDLNLAATYQVSISPDRTEVYVIFENNTVNDVRFYTDGGADCVDISLNTVSSVNVFHLTKPDRVVIDVPSSTITNIFTQPVSGRFTRELRANQFEPYTARVVLELNQKVQHTVSMQGTTVTVRISEPTFRNITYDEDAKTITFSKGGQRFSAAEITHYDAYTAEKYILTLPVDLSAVIGYGEYLVADEYLRSIGIRNNGALTEVTLNERKVLVPQIIDNGDSITIRLLRPRDVYSKVVVIDPGHGGTTAPGAIANGVIEKDINLDIANRVMALLEQDGRLKAYATRTADVDVDLSDRALFGNDVGDLFVSIHNNAAEKNPNANGTEAYYYNHEFEHLLGISGKEVAEIIHKRLIGYLGSYERRVDHANLAVTRESTIPAVLLEIGFVTNPEEAAKLKSAEYQQLTAQAIYDGIIEVFEKYTPRR